MYDITAHSSFRGLERWREEAKSHAKQDSVVTLVGNKIDMKHLRTVERTEAQKYAEQQQLSFIETSASESTNVELAFESIIQEMYHATLFKEDPISNNTLDQKPTITPKDIKTKVPQSKCC